jgi:predicted nucleic acid-binding Zn ribbon protein
MEPQCCVICGKALPDDSRSDRLTCGDTCRKRLSRARHRPPRVCAEALNAIYDLSIEAHLGLFPGDAFRELEFIREYVAGVHADITMHQSPRKWWCDD